MREKSRWSVLDISYRWVALQDIDLDTLSSAERLHDALLQVLLHATIRDLCDY